MKIYVTLAYQNYILVIKNMNNFLYILDFKIFLCILVIATQIYDAIKTKA